MPLHETRYTCSNNLQSLRDFMVVPPCLLHEAKRNSTPVYREISRDRLFSALLKFFILNFLSQDTVSIKEMLVDCHHPHPKESRCWRKTYKDFWKRKLREPFHVLVKPAREQNTTKLYKCYVYIKHSEGSTVRWGWRGVSGYKQLQP